MADFYVDANGRITSNKKNANSRKKKQATYRVDINGGITKIAEEEDDIAPVKSNIKRREEDDSKLDFFQKSRAFDDGWQAGDLTKTILSSAGDAGLEVVKGVGGLVEGVTDLVGYGVGGVAGLFGADDFAAKMKKNAQENTIEKWTQGADDYLEQNSVFGRTADAILQGVGQVGGIIATGGAGAAAGLSTAGVTALTTGAMGLSGMGSGMGEAYKGGATDGEAVAYGTISGAADALTELLFGGLGKAVKATGLSVGLSSADDMLAKKVSNLFSNQIAKNFAEYGIKAGAEGFEEVLAGTAQAIGKKITYMEEEELSEILKDENLLEQFVVGAATSGMIQSGMIPGTREGSLREANKEGRDFIGGLNQNEQAVVDKEVEKRIADEEKNGKTLTKKEKNKIYDAVLSDMERGGISIDTIEEVLGGETFTAYKKVTDAEDAMQREYDELGKKEKYTLADDARYKELGERLKYVREKGAKNEYKARLDKEVFTMVQGSRLMESFNERTRRGQAFEADLTQYDEKQQAVVKKAVESGILNNTRRTHEFVDMVAKIAADKGVSFDFTNNAKLKESGFAIDGKSVNGFVTKDGVTLNVEASKALNSVVGHEITHVLEGTEVYAELQKAVFEYAKTKKDFAGRRGTLAALYQGVEGANVDSELTADLVGDYLFTDEDFIRNLSTKHRNVFQKIYDEIKYLVKIATAGSKEARQLEQVKRAFDKAYRESGEAQKSTAEDGGAKYSLSKYSEKQKENWAGSKRIVIYDNPQQLSQFIQSSVSDKTMNKKMYFGAIPSDLAAKIKADTGVDVESYNLSLGSYEIRKILKDHGSEATEAPRGQRAVSEDDFAHIVDVVLNPQTITLSDDTYMGKPAIVFTGEYNGRMNVIAVVSDKRLDLFVQTVYVNTKKGNLATPTGEQAPINTPEANNGTVSDENVSQKSEDVKTQYSITFDSEGRQLSTEQREYFKDSKVVDESGNLKVLYRSADGGRTVWDGRGAGSWAKGIYLTDDIYVARAFAVNGRTVGDVLEVYADAKNPLVIDAQGSHYMDIPMPEDAPDWLVDSGDWEGRLNADQLPITAFEHGHDAVIIKNVIEGVGGDPATDVILRDSNQMKRTDNTKPTADPDIRFSLSEAVEETDRLVAVHNKSVRGLQRMLDRNGVPFASIAIKKAGTPHEGFGEVSIVFPRTTIDPEANSWNRLYSNDAWTPTEPRTEYDVGDTYKYKKLFENMLGTDIYNALRGAIYLGSDALERELGSSSGDVFEAVKRLGVVKFGYLQSIGQRPEIGTKPVTLDGFGRYKNDQLLAVFEALDGETIRNATYDDMEVLQQIADTLNQQFLQRLPNDDSVFKSFKKKPLYTADKINIVAIQDAYQRWEDAGRTVPTEADTYSLENSLRDNRALEEDEGYRRWVEGIFDGLVKDSGIPNGKDYYTSSGNRRSFKALHVPATLENIVQQMRKEKETGIGSLGGINLRGAATKTYSTVEDMRKDAGKLLGTHIDDDVYDGYMDGFYERLNSLKQRAAKGDSWSSRDTAEQVLLEAIRDAKTQTAMNAMLRKEAQWINYDQSLADELWQLKQDVQNMPAPYFEAKPRRIVTPNEAAAYIVPDNAPASLFAALKERGLTYKTYKAGDEADRLAKLNSVLDEQPDLRFSLSAEGAEHRTFGNYNIYGDDVALESAPAEESAPVEDIAPVAPAAAPVMEAPVTEEEMFPNDIKRTENADFAKIDRLYEDLEEADAMAETLGEQMREAVEDGDYEMATAINDTLVELDTEINATKRELDAELANFAPMTEEDVAYENERLASFEDADAPPIREVEYEAEAESLSIPNKEIDKIAKDVAAMGVIPRRQGTELKKLIQRVANGELSREGLLKEVSDRYGEYTEVEVDDHIKEVKAELRARKLNVSKEVQSDFPEYGQVMRRHFGKVRFSKQGLAVDQLYDEMSFKYPDQFPADIINPADQLEQIFRVADMEHTTETGYTVDDGTLAEVADAIISGVTSAQQSQSQQLREREARDAFNSLMADADQYAPPVDEDIAPVAAAQPVEAPVAPEAPTTETTEAAEDKTIKTVKDRLTAKLNALQTELDDDIRLREESNNAYDALIARLQAEYDGKRNKNTKAANDILRRIERAKSSKASVDAEYAKHISDLGEKVSKVGEELRTGESATEQAAMRRELHAGIVDNMRAVFATRGSDFDAALENAKDLSTISTVDNTPQRVMEKALGYKEGQILADLTVNKVAQNETDAIRWLNGYTNRKSGVLAQLSKKYGIKPGSKESAAAQMYAEGFYVAENDDIIEYGDRELAADFPDARTQANIKGLARDPVIRQIYDETLEMINASRARNAYPEIQKLDNYFLHFRAMDDTFSRLGIPFNPNDIRAKDLPTDLNGVTADLKPGQPYFASAMHRKGKRTSFDLLGGLEMYLSGAKNQIYHIDDIQTLRALRNHIADTYGQAHGLEGLDALTEEEAEARIKDVYGAHLSTFAKFLNEEANVIAGKTSLIDRGLEGIIGRRGITTLDTINRQVGANMVGFNVSSSLTNFISVVQAIAKTSKYDVLKAFTQTVSNKLGAIRGKSDGFMENNPTAIRRKGVERFYRTPWQKASDAGYFMMAAVDNISTELIVRAKYNEFTRKGMSAEDAVIAADKWASRLMGDRSLGQQPQLYNSKMLGLFTKFQLEVRNQLDSQFYDTIQEAKVSTEDIQNAQERNAKKAAKIASTFFQLAVAQHLFGKAFESVAGYNPAFDIIGALIKLFGWDDDEEDEDTVLDNIEQGFLELMGDLPYTSTLTGGRIPISSALPVAQFIKGKDQYGNDKSRLETLGEAAPYYVLPGGYGQIKKTVQGLGMFDDDLPIAGSYTDSGNLRFPVEDTLANRAQAAVFGQWASGNAREYFEEEYAPLKEKQIQEFVDSDLPIAEYRDYREGLKGKDTLGEKVAYIAGLDLPIDTKNLLVNNIADRKDPIDLTNFGEYDDWGEFEYAHKYPEKYAFLEANNISVAQYEAFDEDTKEAWSWAYQNPEKFTLSKAVADDVAVYKQYTKSLSDITADKAADGKTISGSRKTKVIDYINTLDADYGEKIVLFKSEYPADDTYNREIIEYLNNREDISYEDEVTILTELGFTVLPDGTVRW